jgi:demethylmenaquinone methyltransferase/2-methoxy-6-polyprenyl-1,4-benzoquinol methylase
LTDNRLFDRIAPHYDRLLGAPPPERLRDLLELPCPGWMLDAGGGTGRAAAALLPMVGRMAVNDLSLPMLRGAAARGGMLPVQARVERLPYPDAAFQRILVVDAFHHFADQHGAARELARVLAPGGRLVIEEPDIRRVSVKLIALGEWLLRMGSRFRTPEWMRALLEAQGLDAHVHIDGATAWVVAVRQGNANAHP